MKIIGLYGALNWDTDVSGFMHDSGASFFDGGKHIRSISEERLSRIKIDGNFPYKSIDYCLGDVSREEVDVVSYVPPGNHRSVNCVLEENNKKFLKQLFPNAKIWHVRHHLAHAASSVFTSPFNEGSFLTIDGAGSSLWDFAAKEIKFYENTSHGFFDKRKNLFRFYDLPCQPGVNTFGDFYFSFSKIIIEEKTSKKMCFRNRPEGKIMGLSSYGSCDLTDVPYTKSTEYAKNFFNIDQYEFGPPVVNFFDYDVVNNYLNKMGLTPEDKSFWLQNHFQNSIEWFVSSLKDEGYLDDKVCFAGGCFLNINANSVIQKLFSEVHIPPFTDDSGIPTGAALWASYKLNQPIEMPYNIALLGKSYDDCVLDSGDYYNDFNSLCDVVAKALSENKIVGWFQGKSESGPRALGSRSILMSPTDHSNKDTLNSRVKHREYWRPFAGVVPEECASKYFDGGDNPYMLFSRKVIVDSLPAITHEDKTCRIQTVNKKLNPKLHCLLHKLDTPVLLNTSFNDNGEPIVETPEDAINAFKNMDLDLLVIGNYLLWK